MTRPKVTGDHLATGCLAGIVGVEAAVDWVPKVYALRPAAALRSRLVTVKLSFRFYSEPQGGAPTITVCHRSLAPSVPPFSPILGSSLHCFSVSCQPRESTGTDTRVKNTTLN